LGKKQTQGQTKKPADLLEVDLLGLEMLGDQLLGGDLGTAPTQPVPTEIPAKSSSGKRRKSSTNRASKSDERNSNGKATNGKKPKGRSSGSKASRSEKPKEHLRQKREPTGKELEGKELDGKPGGRPQSEKKKANQRSSESARVKSVVPQVPLTVKVKDGSGKQAKTDKPLFDQTYGDLDEILESAGDASPLIIKNTPEPAVAEPPTESVRSRKGTASSFGFLAALSSATLAFWIGVFIVGSRFQVFEWILLGGFSRHLQSIYSSTFGESKVPSGYSVAFQSMGWILWTVALVMILFAVGQFVNSFIKLLTGRQPLAWMDGLVAASGVAIVFLLLAIVFSQSSFAKYEHRMLDSYEQPVVAEGEHLENVTRLRLLVDDRDRSFTTTMLVACTVPMSIFVLSMVRLFTKNLE